MADPLQNLQAMQALFQQPANTFQRAQQTRVSVALNNLRRMQELEDQQRSAELVMQRERMADTRARELANLERDTRLKIAESSEAKADTRAENAEKRADQRAKDAAERAKADREAQEAKAIRAAVREAYSAYADIGGEKKISEFGPEDSIDTLYAIKAEGAAIEKQVETDKFKNAAELVKQEEARLTSLVAPTKEQIEQAETGAIAALGQGPTEDALEFYTAATEKGSPHSIALSATFKAYPGAEAQFRSIKNARLADVQSVNMKRPDFVNGLDSLNRTKSELVKQAMGMRRPGGNELLMSLIAPAQKPAGDGLVDPNAIGVQTGGKPKVDPASGGANPESGYGGLIGLKPMLRNFASGAKLLGTYAAEPPLTALNWLAGGMKRVDEGAAERQTARERIIREYNLRNPQNPIQAAPFW